MNGKMKIGIAIATIVFLLVLFVSLPDLYALPTGFCGVYSPPSLQCQYSTHFSLSAWYFGFGTFYVGGHYFLELGQGITVLIF